MSEIKTFALDLAERAASAFWQAAGPIYAGAQLTDWSQAKAVAVAGSLAGGSAVLSLLKGVLAGARTGTGSLSHQVAGTVPDVPAAALDPDVSLADA